MVRRTSKTSGFSEDRFIVWLAELTTGATTQPAGTFTPAISTSRSACSDVMSSHQAAHHHDLGEHKEAQAHADAGHEHSEQGHKHSGTAREHSRK
jgi:hypothetical protein